MTERINDIDPNRKMATKPKTLAEYARWIRLDWGDKLYFDAKPYVDAMATLETIDQMYGCDTAESIVLYFLANAQTWRGPVAREVKKELNKMVANHQAQQKKRIR